MRVYVLGRGGGCPSPGGAGPGFLVEIGGSRVLLDCGSGVAGRLLDVCPLDALDAVVLSHLHADHVLDVVTLAYGLLARAQVGDGTVQPKRIPLYLPRDETATLAGISAAYGHPTWRLVDIPDASPAYRSLVADLAAQPDLVLALLPPVEYNLDGAFVVGDCHVTTRAMRHGAPTAAMRVEADGATVVYSADTGPTPALAELAQGADLFICEAMAAASGPRFFDAHLTPAEAGAAAKDAHVGALVLTHLSPFADEAAIIAEAAAAFGGPVWAAHEGDLLTLPIGGNQPNA